MISQGFANAINEKLKCHAWVGIELRSPDKNSNGMAGFYVLGKAKELSWWVSQPHWRALPAFQCKALRRRGRTNRMRTIQVSSDIHSVCNPCSNGRVWTVAISWLLSGANALLDFDFHNQLECRVNCRRTGRAHLRLRSISTHSGMDLSLHLWRSWGPAKHSKFLLHILILNVIFRCSQH